MKKLQLFFFVLLVSVSSAFSQSCVVDTNNYSLFSPPSEELPCVIRHQPYNITLQLYCPSTLGGITIDSIRVTAFHNLPTGITKVSTPVNGMMYPENRECIHVSGTTSDTVGFYEITYDGIAYTSVGNPPFSYLRANVPGSLPDYALTVIDSGEVCTNTTTAIKKVSPALTEAFSVYPNPNHGIFELRFNSSAKTDGEINVRDITGRIIYSQKTASPFYETSIDISQYSRGIYFIEYRTADGLGVKKVMVE